MIEWNLDPRNPLIAPGQINGPLDAAHAGSACVIQLQDRYRIYYWAKGQDGVCRICQAESSTETPNEWSPLGWVLEPQSDTDYNCGGPSFPYVLRVDEKCWHLYFGAWGKAREDGKLPNSTGLAISEDGGEAWHYHGDGPVLPMDRPYDTSGTGSVCVLFEDDQFRMYYTSIGEYSPKPDGVQTGHGEIIPRIGVGYAVSEDGIHWTKPLDDLMVAPRGFGTELYEYIASKPWVIREADGYRMWVSTFGTAYRIRSLTSKDGLHWDWVPSGPDGDLGVGEPGAFDDHQRCYASVVKHGEEYRCWYTANGFGQTGIGYAVGERS